MTTPPNPRSHPPFEIRPGSGIGPFRLGMTTDEVEAICRRYGLMNEGTIRSGLGIYFQDGRATQIEIEAVHSLCLAGEVLTDRSDANVRRLIAKIAPEATDWTELEGLLITHYELSDDYVFAFRVYATGHR